MVAFSERAKEIYEPHTGGLGEWLALQGESYRVFNTLAMCDILDREASDADFSAPDRLVNLHRLALRQPPPSELPMIFKLPDMDSRY